MRSNILRTGVPNFDEFSTIFGLVLLIGLLLFSVISFFFSSYKLVVENHDEKVPLKN